VSIDFHGLPARLLSNDYLHLAYLEGAGPRIVHLSLAGAGDNIMAELPDLTIDTPAGPYRLYGGHRLWHAPEAMPRTYVLDDGGCTVQEAPGGAIILGPVEAETGIRKQIQLQLAHDRAAVTVTHRLENLGPWGVELAPWAITQLRLGGTAILPQTRHALDGAGLLPNRNLALWPYARLADPRLSLHDDLWLLQANADSHAIKIGYMNRVGWAAYLTGRLLFVKRFGAWPDLPHVDFGCNCECYCRDRFIELETIGPLVRLQPGESVTHVEEWELIETDVSADDLAGIRRLVASL